MRFENHATLSGHDDDDDDNGKDDDDDNCILRISQHRLAWW